MEKKVTDRLQNRRNIEMQHEILAAKHWAFRVELVDGMNQKRRWPHVKQKQHTLFVLNMHI